MVMMKYFSCQFGDYFSGFGHQSVKLSHTGACIRRNFTPCASSENLVLDQLENPQTYIVLSSHHCLTDIVFICYCKEKFCLGYSWELIKG